MRKIFKFTDTLIIFAFNYFITGNFLFSVAFSFFIFIGIYSFRVYENNKLNFFNEQLVRTISGTFVSFIPVLIIDIIFKPDADRFIYIYNLFFCGAFIPLLHKIYFKFYLKYVPLKKYIVIGKKDEIMTILNEIYDSSFRKIEFIDFLNPSPEKLEKSVNKFFKAEDNVEYDKKNYGILVADPVLFENVKDQVEQYKNKGMKVEYLPTVAEKYLQRIPMLVLKKFKDYYDVAFDDVEHYPPFKIFSDYLIGFFLLIIFSPFMLVMSLFLLIEDGFPIIFRQKRMGFLEEEFVLWKLRSLKKGEIDPDNPNRDIEERMLVTGKIARKIRMDESFQFFNVLKGDMSIVGPRPEMLEFHYKMKDNIPFYTKRLHLKPGITGWAQIYYKHTSTLEDYIKKTEYDLYYVKNRNSVLDIQIMLKTLETMIGMKGSR